MYKARALRAYIVFMQITTEVYNKWPVWNICTLKNYKVTHLLKGFPRYRRIKKRTQLPVGLKNGHQHECEHAVHYPDTRSLT